MTPGPAIEDCSSTLFLEAHTSPPRRIILDLDATDDPIHGHQLGRFFHGYYDYDCLYERTGVKPSSFSSIFLFDQRAHLFVPTLVSEQRGAQDRSRTAR